MPILPMLATAVPAIMSMFNRRQQLGQLAGQGIQAGINGLQNLFQRRYERRMWQQQVSQQERAWTMQNDYNSPLAQMERLREAGLNPNLVYGNGATHTASSLPVSSPTISRRQPIDLNPANSILAAQDLKIKQAQYDNLRANNTAIAQDVALKTANLSKVAADTAKSRWEVERSKSLFASAMDAAKLNNERLTQGLMVQKGDYEMRQALGMQGLQKGILSMAYMQAQTAKSLAERQQIYQNIELMKKSGVLKDWEIQLSQQGIRPGDPLWQRTVIDGGKKVLDAIGNMDADGFRTLLNTILNTVPNMMKWYSR